MTEVVPIVYLCRVCGCPLQRTPDGTLADGIAAHYVYVHPHRTPEDPPRPSDFQVRNQ